MCMHSAKYDVLHLRVVQAFPVLERGVWRKENKENALLWGQISKELSNKYSIKNFVTATHDSNIFFMFLKAFKSNGHKIRAF